MNAVKRLFSVGGFAMVAVVGGVLWPVAAVAIGSSLRRAMRTQQ